MEQPLMVIKLTQVVCGSIVVPSLQYIGASDVWDSEQVFQLQKVKNQLCVLLSCGFNFGPRNNSENVLTGLLKTQTKYNFYPIYHSIFKKSETPSASVIQMSDGRLFGKLIDGKYGKHGLTVVVLIEAGIVKYV